MLGLVVVRQLDETDESFCGVSRDKAASALVADADHVSGRQVRHDARVARLVLGVGAGR